MSLLTDTHCPILCSSPPRLRPRPSLPCPPSPGCQSLTFQNGLELEALAESFIEKWDEYADREFTSNEYGFDFVSRQTEYEENVWTLAKAFVPDLTLDHIIHFRENMVDMIPLFDNRLTVFSRPDFEGKRCLITKIKMPMVLSDRSFVNLYYSINKPDGSLVSIASSKGSEEVVAASSSIIKKNVVANNIIQYVRSIPRDGGCDIIYVQAMDIAGSIPDALKRSAAADQARSAMTQL